MILVGASAGVVVVHLGGKRTGTAETLTADHRRIRIQLVKDMEGAISKKSRASLEQGIALVAAKPNPLGDEMVVIDDASGTRGVPVARCLLEASA